MRPPSCVDMANGNHSTEEAADLGAIQFLPIIGFDDKVYHTKKSNSLYYIHIVNSEPAGIHCVGMMP